MATTGEELQRLFVRIGADITELQAALRQVNGEVDATNAKLKNAGGVGQATLDGMAAAAKRASQALLGLTVAAGAIAVKGAADFQTQLAKIDNLTNTSTEDANKLGDAILQMSKSIPKSPAELGAGAYLALSSGINDVGEAMKIVTAAAKASAVGVGGVADIVRLTTAAIKIYGAANITAAQATDILVATVKEGSGEADALAGAMGRVLPVAAILGVQFDELGAALATLTNGGLNADEAVTGLLGILNQLSGPQSKSQIEALKSIGTNIDAVRASIQDKGFIQTMRDLALSFGGNTDELGKLLPEIRGFNAFLSAFGTQGNAAVQTLDNIRNSAGVTDDAFAKMSKTVNFQAGILKNELQVALMQIGKAVLPDLIAALREVIAWLDKNQAAIQLWAKTSLAAAKIFIGDFIDGMKAIGSALDIVIGHKGLFIAAVAAMGVAVYLAFGPASLAMGALLTLVAIIGKINDMLHEQSQAALPAAYERQAQLQQQLGDLGGGPRGVGNGLPVSPAVPGSQADQTRKAQIAELQTELDTVTARINTLEGAEGKGQLGAKDGLAPTQDVSKWLDDFNKQLDASKISLGEASAAEKANADAAAASAEEWKKTVDSALTALSALQSAASEMFGQPTRQMADANARLQKLLLTQMQLGGAGKNKAIDDEIGRIKARIAILDQEHAVEQARIAQADKSLLSEQQQKEKTDFLVKAIGDTSSKLHTLTDDLGLNFSPALRDAAKALGDLNGALATINASAAGGPKPPAYASGTSFVPEDMLAFIHQGEMIVPAGVAEQLRSGSLYGSSAGGGGGTAINFNGPIHVINQGPKVDANRALSTAAWQLNAQMKARGMI